MGSRSNLKEDCYTPFANYMAEVAQYFKQQKGIEFTLISPVNEPQYNWNEPSQEGTAWQNSEIRDLTVELDKALEAKGLTNTRILLAEAGDWEYTYKEKSDANRSNVIYNLFDPASRNYVGNLPHVFPAIAGHSYWTDGSWSTLYSVRQQVASAAAAYNLKVYQTEWSMLGAITAMAIRGMRKPLIWTWPFICRKSFIRTSRQPMPVPGHTGQAWIRNAGARNVVSTW